jgi:HSP20 family molecular chaperone IbpA
MEYSVQSWHRRLVFCYRDRRDVEHSSGLSRLVLVFLTTELEAEDISVSINDKTITIMGQEQGPGKHDREPTVCEWTIGPYFREVALDQPVDGLLMNATYGNGVSVLNMPKAADGEPMPANFRLNRIDATRGERVGYKGTEIHPSSS